MYSVSPPQRDFFFPCSLFYVLGSPIPLSTNTTSTRPLAPPPSTQILYHGGSHVAGAIGVPFCVFYQKVICSSLSI